jgi:ribosomal protein S18 acetylase RimI-like enzyme
MGVWHEVQRRTLSRLGGYAVRLLLEIDLGRLVETPAPEGVEIRVFAGPDWSAVGRLARMAATRQADAAAAGRLCLVAFREGQPIGCVWFSEMMENRHEGYELSMPSDAIYIWQVEVAPQERGRGIACALVVNGLQRARKRGHARGWAIIARNNQRSLRAFAKVGSGRVLGTVARLKVGTWMLSRCRRLPVPLPTEAVIRGAGNPR